MRKIPLTKTKKKFKVDFKQTANMALSNADYIVTSLLPNGKREGREWVAFNPKRPDQTLGSFKINLGTGKWADFATLDRGSDLISLVAYLKDTTQYQAAKYLAEVLGGGVC